MVEKKFVKKKLVDSKNGFLFRHIYSDTERVKPHTHDYYEIFLIIKGSFCHLVNSKKQMLTKGHLVFIRDFDVHNYLRDKDDYFEALNITFSKTLFSSILDYLGDDFPTKKFLLSEAPPFVALNPGQTEKLRITLSEMGKINKGPYSELKIKSLLTDIFVNYFFDYDIKAENIPDWLAKTCETMKKPDNFIAGSKKMIELSGKTREHLSRSLKKYYQISLSEFVNNLRLEHCANMLIRTTLPVVDICYKCGFDNLSWFYKIFESKFGTTPSKYRKHHEVAKYPTE